MRSWSSREDRNDPQTGICCPQQDRLPSGHVTGYASKDKKTKACFLTGNRAFGRHCRLRKGFDPKLDALARLVHDIAIRRGHADDTLIQAFFEAGRTKAKNEKSAGSSQRFFH